MKWLLRLGVAASVVAWFVGVGAALMNYRVTASTKVRNEAPPAPSGTRVRIAVFGDSQKGLANLEALAGIAAAEHCDLGISTGDFVAHNDDGHWKLARHAVRSGGFDRPFLVAAGNHDLKGAPGVFERNAGPAEWSFRWGPVDLVSLPTWPAPHWGVSPPWCCSTPPT